jgi:hypothetical protein
VTAGAGTQSTPVLLCCASCAKAISAHVEALREWTYAQLSPLKHSNGQPLLRIFGAHERGGHVQSALFQFLVLHSNGSAYAAPQVQESASNAGLHLRAGEYPGAAGAQDCRCGAGDRKGQGNVGGGCPGVDDAWSQVARRGDGSSTSVCMALVLHLLPVAMAAAVVPRSSTAMPKSHLAPTSAAFAVLGCHCNPGQCLFDLGIRPEEVRDGAGWHGSDPHYPIGQ